jgi:pectin methylesterase-like acyl-CoA thioesterase
LKNKHASMKKSILRSSKTVVLFALMVLGFMQAKAYDVTVAKDGSGNFTTVQAAIDAAPTGRTTAYTIFIKNGKYREKISLPSNKPFLFLVGESVANTILSWDDYSGKPNPAGGTFGTSNSASVTFNAVDCGALNITFENTTGDAPQALAINVNADRCAFKNCRFLGGQDTVLTNSANRQYFRNCYIDGVVDFIFGAAIAVFDSCVIYPKTRLDNLSGSYLTAANTAAGQTYGYVFRDCVIPANRGVTSYVMGRPWQNDGTTSPVSNTKVVFINTTMSSSIKPQGWDVWNASTNTSLITYAEYRSRKFDSSLVDISQRVSWSQQLTAAQAVTYTTAAIFGTWNPCAALAEICTYTEKPIAVSNFRGVKGTSTSAFTWNISWPINGVKYELFRSNDKVAFSKVNEQISNNDSSINYAYSETIPPPGQTWYYYIIASKSGLATHQTDTVVISSTPTINVTGAMGSFVQGVGTPSTSQSYVVSGASLTNNVIITAPTGYEISSNGGSNWNNSSTPIVLTQDINGNIPNTSISVRLNASSAATYSGNITHTSTGATSVNMAVTGTVQSAPLSVSSILQQWPMTLNSNDSVNVRLGTVASAPTLNKLYLSNGTTVANIPAYSPAFGQAFGATANGDGSWGTAVGGPGGNLNRTFYEQFTITAASTHSIRVDSFILNTGFQSSVSNTKIAAVYSLTGFTTADSTNVTGGIGPDGLSLPPTANGGFTTPAIIATNEGSGTTINYRFALNGATGITLTSGQTITIRLYFSCGSSSTGRYAKVRDVVAKGLATPNPTTGDYRSKQSGDWTALSTWERWDGSAWVTPAPDYPVYNNSGTTNILNGHTVTVSATLANGSGYIHLAKINAGAQLIVNAGANLNLANDGSLATTDLQVDGVLTVLGGLFTNGNVSVMLNGSFVYSGTNMNLSNTGDTMRVGAAGVYQHNANSNSSPKVMLCQPSSTFSVTGITTNQTDIFKSTSVYGNIIWNCASQANYYAFRNKLDSANVKGSFTVVSTGTTYISFANTSCNITFPGGYYQTGGTVNYRENSTITDTLTLGGDFSVTGGSFISNFGTGTSLLVRLNGINKSINYTQATATNTNWNVAGIYNLAGNLTLPNSTFGLTVGGTLNLGTNTVSGAGDFILSPSAILSTGSATGLNGNITVTGTKTLGTTSSYVYNGSAAQVTGTLLPATINSLTINNATGVSLSSNLAIVGGPLTLTTGKLLLGANNLSTSSITGASSSNYVVTDGAGSLKLNNIGAGANLFPVGLSTASYNPLTINNTGTADNFSVNVKNTFSNPFPNPSRVVNTQWNITEDVVGGSNATVGLSWILADQAASFNPASNLNVMHYVGSAWVPTSATLTGAGTVASPYYATAAGFTSFSPFAVANLEAVPLNLLSFSAGYDKNEVKATWNTSNEVNTASFIIERSIDGVAFNALGSVTAKNGINNTYSFADANPVKGIAYYRLKILDKDGTFKYSRVVVVNSKLKGLVTVYPNPSVSSITVTHEKAMANAIVEIRMIDGRKVVSQQLEQNSLQTSIDLSKLASGSYLLTIINGQEKTTVPFVKQ